MNVLIVGGGGREHALAWAVSHSKLLTKLWVSHNNPAFIKLGATLCNIDQIIENEIDLVIIGPEAPLADGVSDNIRKLGVAVFGPSRLASQLESSKAFAKQFMNKYHIPTARYGVFDSEQKALEYIDGPCVVKADGLAAGKGVTVCTTAEEAAFAVKECFQGRFGEAGSRVIIEELLVGPEVSIIALCDGEKAKALKPCRDHKRRFDGNKGPNTGGMGAICPPSDVGEDLVDFITEQVLQPTVDAMKSKGTPFIGALYAGVMLCDDGPKVLEFNVRFGDPETQPLMMMLDEDWLNLFWNAANGKLDNKPLRWKDGASCCVTMSGKEYPRGSSKGVRIDFIPEDTKQSIVFYSGVVEQENNLYTNGGRVLSVCHYNDNLQLSIEGCYRLVSKVSCNDLDYRSDIGR